MRGVLGILVLAAAALGVLAALPGAEATTPTLSTFVHGGQTFAGTLDTHNDGTWASKLTITFNTPMKAQTDDATALAGIVVKQGIANSNIVSYDPVTGHAIEFSGNTVIIRYLPAQEDGLRRHQELGSTLWIKSDALASADTSTNFSGFGRSGTIGSGTDVDNSSEALRWARDSTTPKVASATLDKDTGVLYIVADESLAYGQYGAGGTKTATYPTTLNSPGQTANANATKFHLRDGATASTGGIDMSASNSPSTHRSPVHEIRFTLSPTQLSTLIAYTNPHLHIDADAFEGLDSDGDPGTNPNAAIAKQLNYLPRLSAAELTVTTRALSLTFDESVTKNSGTFYIRNSDTGAYDSSTDVTGTLAVSGTGGTATLTASDVTRVLGMSTPHLHLNAGAVTDAGGADNLKKVRALTVTHPSPELSAAALAGTTLTLTLDIAVKSGDADVDQSKVRVRDGAGTSGGTALAGSTVSSTGDSATVTLTLTSSQVTTVEGYAAPHVYLEAGAVTSTNNVAGAAPSLSRALGIQPELESASVDLNNFTTGSGQNTAYYAGKLTLNFNVDVGVNASDADTLPKITVREADNSPTVTLDTNASIITSTATVEIGLTPAQKEAVRGMSGNLEVLIGAGAFKSDTGSLALPAVADGDLSVPAASVTADTTGPRIASAAINEGTGIVTLDFDELVQADSADINLGNLQIYTPGEGNYPLTGSAVTSSGDAAAVTVRMTEPIRQNVIALSNPQYWFSGGAAIQDLDGNFVPANTIGESEETADTLKPELSSAALDEGTGVLTLTFGETVKAGDSDVDQAKIYLVNNAAITGGTSLNGATVSSTGNSAAVTIQLTETQRQSAIGYASPHVYFDAEAVKDTSDQTIAASTTQTVTSVADEADDDKPTLSSASLNQGAGVWSVTFSERVSAGSASGTVMYIGTGTTYNSAADVALTVPSAAASASGTLSASDIQKVLALTGPKVYVVANAVQDTSNNGIAAANVALAKAADTTAPTLSSASLNQGTGAWTVAFSEIVSAGSAVGTTIYVGTSTTYNSTNDVALTVPSTAASASGTLSTSDIQKVIAMTGARVYVVANAVQDTSSNGIAAANVSLAKAADTTAPTLSSASLNQGTGAWTVAFSEIVSAGSAVGTTIYVGTSTTYNSTNDVALTVPSTAASASGTLSTSDIQKVIAMTGARVYVVANAVQDTSNNGIAAANISLAKAADTTAPTLSSASLNQGTGAWTVAFSEIVSAGSAVGTTIYVGTSTTYNSTNDVALTVPSTAASASGTLSTSDIQKVIAMTGARVYVVANAVQDTSSNGIAAANVSLAKAADTTAPTLSSASLNQGTGAWTVAFSEIVSAGSAVGTTIYVGTSTTYNSTNDVALTVPSTAASASGTLSTSDIQKVIAMTGARVYVVANAVQDTSSNGIAAANVSLAKAADTTAPTLSSASLNQGTGAWSVTFSEIVSAGSAVGTTIYVGTSTTYNSTNDVALTVPSTAASASGTLSVSDIQKVIAMTGPKVYVVANAVQDTSSNGIAAANVALAKAADTTAPTLSSASIHEGTGAWTVTFSEIVSAGSASGTVMYVGENSTYDSDTDVALTVPSLAASSSGTLGEADRQKVIAMGTPSVYVVANAVKDTSDRQFAATAGVGASITQDTTPPALDGSAAPDLDEGTGTLTLTFGETVKAGDSDVQQNLIYIRDGAGTTGGVSLSSATVSSTGNGLVVTLELKEAERQSAIGYADPHVRFAPGAVKDTSNQDVAAATVRIDDDTTDTIPPQLLSAAFDEGDGTLTLTFDETVKAGDSDVGQASMHVRDGAGQSSGGETLTGAAVTSTGNSARVTVELGEEQRQAVIGYANPHFYFGAGAVQDTSGTALGSQISDADISVTTDSVDPALLTGQDTRPEINEGTGEYTVRFSETVSAGTASGTSVYVRDGAGAYDPATDVRLAVPSSAVSVSGTLGEADRQRVVAMGTPTVHAVADAVQDTRGNGSGAASSAAAITPDTIKPELSSAALDEGTGILRLTFGETVKAGSSDVVRSGIHVADGAVIAGGTSLDGATVSSTGNGLVVTVQLTEVQRQAAIGYTNPYVYLDAAAVKDTSDQTVAASTAQTAVRVADETDDDKPTVVSAELDEAEGRLTVEFSETVHVTGVSPEMVSITKSGDASMSLALGENQRFDLVLSDGATKSVRFIMTEQQRVSVSALAPQTVVLSAGAVNDTSDNDLDAETLITPGKLTVVQDSTPPSVSSVSMILDASSPSASVRFTESVRNLDTAQLSVAETSPRTGSQALSQSAALHNGDRLAVIPLTEAERTAISGFSGTLRLAGASGAWSDAAGNSTPGDSEDIDMRRIGQDTHAPALSSAAVNLSGLTMSMTFGETVDVSEFQPARITVTSSNNKSGTLLSSVTSTEDGNTVVLGLSGSEALRISRASQLSAPAGTVKVSFESGAWKDLAGNPNAGGQLAGVPVSGSSSETVRLVYSVLNVEGRPSLDLYFDGQVDLSAFDASKIDVKDGSGANKMDMSGSPLPESTNNFSPSGAIPSSAASKVVLPLSLAQKKTANGYSSATLDADQGAWTSVHGVGSAALSAVSVDGIEKDGAGPLLASVHMAYGAGSQPGKRFLLTFEEPVDASTFTKVHHGALFLDTLLLKANLFQYNEPVRDNNNAIVNYTTQAAADAVRPGDSDCETRRYDANMTTIFRRFCATTLEEGHVGSLQINNLYSGAPSPSSGFARTMTIGIYNNFVQEMTRDLLDPATLGGNTYDLRPGSTSLPLRLWVPSNTVSDVAGNPTSPTRAFTVQSSSTDAMPVSASLDLSAPSLTLTFDRNLSSLDPSKIYVGGPASTSATALDGGTALSGSVTGPSVVASSASSTAVISLSAAELSALTNMVTTDGYPRLLHSDAGAWSVAGIASPNFLRMMPVPVSAGAAAGALPSAPSLTSASLDLSSEPSALSLAFDRAVDVSEFRTYQLHVSADAAISDDDASLFLPTSTAADGTAVSVPLTGAQKEAVQAMSGSPVLLYEAGTWQDAQGNRLASGGSQALSITPDASRPSLSRSELDRGAGLLSLTFSEKVGLGGGSALLVASAGQSSQTYTVPQGASSVAEPGAQHSTRIDALLTEAQRSAMNAFLAAPGSSVSLSLEAGYVSDVTGNPLAAVSGASLDTDTPDTQVPLLLSATVSTADKMLTLVFDETVDASSLDLTKFAFSNIGETSQLYLDDSGTLDDAALAAGQQDSPTLVVELTDAQADFAASQRVPHIDVDSGAYQDTAGNALASNAHDLDLLVQQDTVPPALQSASLEAHSGVLTLVFDDAIDAAPSYNVDLAAVYLSRPGQADERSLSGASLATSTDTDTLSVRLDENSRRQAIDWAGQGGVEVDVSAGAFSDIFRNRIGSQPDTAVAYSADATPPELVSASLDGVTGRLVMTFSEAVRSPDLAKILISSDTGTGLAGGTVDTAGPGAAVIATLSEPARQDIVKKTGALDIELQGGAVADYAGVPVGARAKNLASPLLAFSPDASAPALELAVLNLGSAELVLTFSEPVWRADLSKITVGGHAMAGASVGRPALDSETVTISDIPEATVSALVQLSGLSLDLDSGAVYDSSNNPVAAAQGLALRTSADSTAPVPLSAGFVEESGVLTVSFDESVRNPDASMISMSASLQGAQASASGSDVTVTLTEQQRLREVAAIGGSASVRVSMQAGAVLNLSAISVEASSIDAAVEKDSTPPSLVSRSLDLNDGTLVLRFSETVLVSRLSGISAGGQSLGSANLSGDRTSELTMSLPESARQALIGQSSPSVSVEAGAVSDASGNAPQLGGALSVAPDTTAPEVLRVGVNLNTGLVRIVLDEWVQSSGIDASLMAVRGGGAQVTLGGSASASQDTVRLQLSAEDLATVASVQTSTLDFVIAGGAGIADTAGNALADTTQILRIDDPVPPQLVSARITGPSSILVEFSEDLMDSSISTSAFRVGQLAITSAVEASGGTVLLTVQDLPEGQPQQVTALAGGVRDNSDNALASDRTVNAPWRPALIDIVSLEMYSDGPNPQLAGIGDTVRLVFSTSTDVSAISGAEVTLSGRTTEVSVTESGFTAAYTVSAGDSEGPVSLAAVVRNEAGSALALSGADLRGEPVRIDTSPPELETAMFAGSRSVLLVFSEPVLTTSNDYDLSVDGSPVTAGAANSGLQVIMLVWAGSVTAMSGTSTGTLQVSASLTDVAGNAFEPAAVQVSGAQTEISLRPLQAADAPGSAPAAQTGSGRAPVTPVPVSEEVRSVSFEPVGGPAVPAIDLSQLPDLSAQQAQQLCQEAGRQLSAGCSANTALVGPLTVSVGGLVERVEFAAGTRVAGLPPNEQLRVYAAAEERAGIALSGYDRSDDALGYRVEDSRTVELGSPQDNVLFSEPVRAVFDPLALYRGTLVYSIDADGRVLTVPECRDVSDSDSAKAFIEGSDARACVDYGSSSVWTMHFTVFGVAEPVRGGSECDDCTPPTLGYDAHGARLVSGGFAYNGLVSDVEYFFTPYPLIESEVGRQNNITLKIYENEGPGNIERVSVAFGLRSGEVISESKAVINYDVSFDGTGSLSVIDPENAIDLETLSAEHRTAECSAGSELQCLSVSINHSFRAPLEFDIVGTDVWDTQRNSWQNYFNHGIRVTGESLNPVPGVRVNGGELLLHPLAEGSNNVDVMAGEDGALYRLAPDGLYKPLRNISSLFHEIDESMYTYDGIPMQGYDRSDPQFQSVLEEQLALARAVLEQMNLGRQGWQEGFEEAEQSVHTAIDRMEALRADLQAERERAERLFLERYGPTDRPE